MVPIKPRLKIPCTLRHKTRTANAGPYNEPTFTVTETETTCHINQLTRAEGKGLDRQEHGNVQTETGLCLLDFTETVDGLDEIVVGARTYQVDGIVDRVYDDRTGTLHHLEARLSRAL